MLMIATNPRRAMLDREDTPIPVNPCVIGHHKHGKITRQVNDGIEQRR
jgi:hypothetical protein